MQRFSDTTRAGPAFAAIGDRAAIMATQSRPKTERPVDPRLSRGLAAGMVGTMLSLDPDRR
ncbi:hypothetical protein GCM10011317_09340 [Niveispirillum cyanobacteriorum]|nr:hypothetical protein GCM10011317_09340 [Niveispirillum cyanobacteriorum]